MKYLTAAIMLLLVSASSQTLRAQTADSWVLVAPASEQFTTWMPNGHEAKSQQTSFDKFKLNGHAYTATEDGVVYTVWSFANEGEVTVGSPDNEVYLDACADLVWESLLKPRRDQVPKLVKSRSDMSYQGELNSPARGREYTITLGLLPGVTRFYVAGPQVYVLTVLNAEASSAASQRFIHSFSLSIPGYPLPAIIKDPMLPFAGAATGGIGPGPTGGTGPGTGGGIGTGTGGGIGTGTGGGIGPGRAGNVGGGDRILAGPGPSSASGETDYNKVFIGRDVTQKARILSKPEPQYTESARKYSVTGTVVLRAVFSSSGQVTQIRAVRGLPHGLTLRSIAAARNIRFTPAVKDGHNVSMWFQLEYNYNLY